MVHAFAVELLWLVYHPEERHGFPASVTVTAQASHNQHAVFRQSYFVRIYRGPSVFLILPTCSSTLHPGRTRPHSPTTLAYTSITTQAPPAAPILPMAKLIMHRHLCIPCHLSTWLT
jgi:hypothetical protein